jgi:hypothetical protein
MIDESQIPERLEYLRSQIRAECISYGELAELEDLAEYIEPGDVELLEAAGVPEFEDEPEDHKWFCVARAMLIAQENAFEADNRESYSQDYADVKTGELTEDGARRWALGYLDGSFEGMCICHNFRRA